MSQLRGQSGEFWPASALDQLRDRLPIQRADMLPPLQSQLIGVRSALTQSACRAECLLGCGLKTCTLRASRIWFQFNGEPELRAQTISLQRQWFPFNERSKTLCFHARSGRLVKSMEHGAGWPLEGRGTEEKILVRVRVFVGLKVGFSKNLISQVRGASVLPERCKRLETTSLGRCPGLCTKGTRANGYVLDSYCGGADRGMTVTVTGCTS